ncbi:hypothetical protein WR25_20720 [Diploscapter pachys]|uniref:Ribosomal protein S11 n=1 Tax=Diploscapter pachys TaxID=2018661 RepID=A0A2A2KNH4_9BILA|nr:hypothetical protein WR25_20720 [Diploscapter pachys]
MAARNLALQFSRLALGTRASCSQILPIRSISSSLPKFDSIRDNHRAGTRLTGPEQEIFEGTTGANQLLSVNLKNIEARFPTSETLNQLFDGIPYKDLPIVYIKATKNNTLINVMDNKQHVIIYTSCRLEGFKHARKKTTIAGQTTGVAAGQKLVRRGIRTVRVEVFDKRSGGVVCFRRERNPPNIDWKERRRPTLK